MPVLTEADFDWPTNEQYRQEIRNDLARIARETGAKSIHTMLAEDAEERRMEELKLTPMARGLSNRDAPHSAKAVKDKRIAYKAATPGAKAKARQREAKEQRAEKAKVLALGTAKITIVDKDFTFGKEGTARNRAWLACKKSKTVGEYLKNGGVKKYLARWEKAGAIKVKE